jgi:gliding motility-associated-like protein
MPKNSGIYRVEAINQYGCKAIDETAIEITNYYNIYIPNVFTPNADGNNDEFLVYGTGITELQMEIFDRWGEKLYTSNDQLKGWNGSYLDVLCKNDVYVYLIIFKTIDGKKHTKTGHVTILK